MEALIDNFIGDSEELYSLVIEEIKRSLPDVEFGWSEEVEKPDKWLDKGQKVRMLSVTFRYERVFVFALQVGMSFFVSTRDAFRKTDRTYIQNVYLTCFDTIVSRSTRKALARYLESRKHPVPGFLLPEDIFGPRKAEAAAVS